jgi:hypothetical protein
MTERNIFDEMAKARYNALAMGKVPTQYSINPAGIIALAMDERITRVYSSVPLEDRPFMGIPIKVNDNRFEDWQFSLSVQPSNRQ